MTSEREKAYCVLEFAKNSSVIVVQRHFRAKFGEEAPHRHNITSWMKKFEKIVYAKEKAQDDHLSAMKRWKTFVQVMNGVLRSLPLVQAEN